MIYFYSGTPRSGKSLEVAQDICMKMRVKKQNVIANFEINRDEVAKFGPFDIFTSKKIGRFYYFDNNVLTPQLLISYAIKFHKKGVENQTLLVIDEAQVLLSPTSIKLFQQENKMYRQNWLKFFTQHGKLGYSIIIISQFDKLIDAQFRCLFEYNQIHRKVNNYKVGWILAILHISLFCSVCYWYGVKERIGCHFFIYHKKYSRIYDSYKIFDDTLKFDKDYFKLVQNQ